MMGFSGFRISGRGCTQCNRCALDRSLLGLLVRSAPFDFESNDGPVGRYSNQFGTVLRGNHRTRHFDQLNRFAGLRGFTNPLSV